MKMPSLILFIQRMHHAGNVASILRTAEVMAVDRVILYDCRSYSPTVTKGSHLWLSLEFTDDPNILDIYKKEGYRIIGIENDENAISMYEYRYPEKSLLILGSEMGGIEPAIYPKLEDTVIIPQYGVTKCLNVVYAGAIALYEFRKQYPYIG
jgi:tRNA guanosine-2'-O-methyltransferase